MAKQNVDTITDTDVLEAPQNKRGNSDNLSTSQAPKVNNNYTAIKEIPRDSRIFLLANDKRMGNVIMDFEEDVIDPDTIKYDEKGNRIAGTGKTRRMRLLRGAQSIWLDEQTPAVFPKEYVQKNTITKTFSKGKLIVPMHENLVLKAMEISNRNTGNKNRQGAKDIYYYEWNPILENEKQMKSQDLMIKAMRIAMDAPMEKLIPHIYYLNIQVVDLHGVPLEESALRTAYITYASTNSDKFLKSVDSPNVQTGYMIRKAIENNTIDIGTQVGSAYWSDGGFITNIPSDKDPLEYLVDFANMYNDNSTAFMSQLRQLSS